MTVEEYIASLTGREASTIEFHGVKASPGYAWSDVTIEGFECVLLYSVAGDPRRLLALGRTQTCDFLNAVFPRVERIL